MAIPVENGILIVPRAAAGAPSSGAWLKGTVICDNTGTLYVCEISGSPGTWVQVGSGGGGGGGNPDGTIPYDNLLWDNGLGTTGVSGWTVYNDGSVNLPVDGTGGTPVISYDNGATESIGIASGTYFPSAGPERFRITLPNSTACRGNGVSIQFKPKKFHHKRILTFSGQFRMLDTGGFTWSDGLAVCVLNSSNDIVGSVTCGSPLTFPHDDFVWLARLSFVADEDETYRLCVHVRNNNSGANSKFIYFDNLRIREEDVSEWVYGGAPEITAETTNPTKGTVQREYLFYRKVGTDIEAEYLYWQTSAGSNGTGQYRITLPPFTPYAPGAVGSIPSYTMGQASVSVSNNQAIMGQFSIGLGTYSIANSGDFNFVSAVLKDETKFYLVGETFVWGAGFKGLVNSQSRLRLRIQYPVREWRQLGT